MDVQTVELQKMKREGNIRDSIYQSIELPYFNQETYTATIMPDLQP